MTSTVLLILSFLILSISLEEGDQDSRKEEREQQQEEEEDGALDRQACRAALASLRHAKWFQVSSSHSLMIKVVELELKN